MGLRDEDAADAAQETLLEFFRDFRGGRYQRERGRLRHWLLAIARHRVRDALARRRREAPEHGDTWIDAQPGEAELERLWEVEVGEEILRRALAALRRTSDFDERTLAVFEAYVLLGQEPSEIAARHGLSLSTIYAVKSRGLKRLGELRLEFAREFEEA
jgi:RNA polymerase sigma factor (sigma-70 family)